MKNKWQFFVLTKIFNKIYCLLPLSWFPFPSALNRPRPRQFSQPLCSVLFQCTERGEKGLSPYSLFAQIAVQWEWVTRIRIFHKWYNREVKFEMKLKTEEKMKSARLVKRLLAGWRLVCWVVEVMLVVQQRFECRMCHPLRVPNKDHAEVAKSMSKTPCQASRIASLCK